MKVLAILMIAALAVAQAQPPPPPGGIQTGGGGWVGGSPAIAGLGFGYNFQPQFIFQDIILQNEAQKLLAQVDLPVDLQLRIADVLAEAQLGFDKSVYSKLLNPQLNEAGESAFHSDLQPAQNGVESNGHLAVSDSGIDVTFSADAELSEPPGFARLSSNRNGKSDHKESLKEVSGIPVPSDGKAKETYTQSENNCSLDPLIPESVDVGAPPGFAIGTIEKNPDGVNDEDPEVPPGFG